MHWNTESGCPHIRPNVKFYLLPHLSAGHLWQTMSIGVVVIEHLREMTTPEIISLANDALSAAKNDGRDRVEVREVKQD